MAEQWKPGDVAIIENGDWKSIAIVAPRREAQEQGHPPPLQFLYAKAGFDMVDDLAPDYTARRLVVIDPEDREQARHLAQLFAGCCGVRLGFVVPDEEVTNMQAALREFANPTPPRCNQHLGIEYADNKGRVYSCSQDAGHDGPHEDADERMTWTVRDA